MIDPTLVTGSAHIILKHRPCFLAALRWLLSWLMVDLSGYQYSWTLWISSFGSPPHTQICFLIHTKSSENSMTFNIWRGDARVLYILPRVRDEQKHRTTPQLLRLCLSAVASIGSPTGPNRSHWTITPRNQSKGEVSIQAEFSLLSWANIIDTPLQGSFH